MPTRSWQTAFALIGSFVLPVSFSVADELKTESQGEVRIIESDKSLIANPLGAPQVIRKGHLLIRLPNGETRTIPLPNGNSPFVHLDAAASEQTLPKHLIGIALAEIPDSLRAHVTLPDGVGVLVGSVIPDGPAAQAGLQPHDILLKVGDQEIKSIPEMQKLIDAIETQPVVLTYIRKGEPKTVEVTPVKRDELKMEQGLSQDPNWTDLLLNGSTGQHPQMLIGGPGMPGTPMMWPLPASVPSPQVDALTESIRQLTEQIERLQKSVNRLEKRQGREDGDEKEPADKAPEERAPEERAKDDGDARHTPRRALLIAFRMA